MQLLSAEKTFDKVERCIQESFPNVPIKFVRRSFPEHLELIVYVLKPDEYDAVRTRCDQVVEQMHLDDYDPEMWVMARSLPGPWPGGPTVEEMQARREDFLRRHNMVLRPLSS